jgi:urea transport system ATP-binding protein
MLEVTAIDLYYGAAQALRAVSLTARPGEVTCVLGRNGVGKTSLLRALVGQHAISNGAIVFDGHDVAKLRPYERARAGIAYVPQGPRNLSAAHRGRESQDRFCTAQARPAFDTR